MQKSSGPSKDPCGIPLIISSSSNLKFSTLRFCFFPLGIRKALARQSLQMQYCSFFSTSHGDVLCQLPLKSLCKKPEPNYPHCIPSLLKFVSKRTYLIISKRT